MYTKYEPMKCGCQCRGEGLHNIAANGGWSCIALRLVVEGVA